MRNAVCVSLSSLAVVLLAGAASAEQLPPGVGLITPSGSVFTTAIGPGRVGAAADFDDYVFRGYPGMVLTAVVKLPKGSTLVPELEIQRPDGVAVTDDDGLTLTRTPKSVSGRVVLDLTGWWKVRVGGAVESVSSATGDVTRSTGDYSLSVKYTAPKLPVLPVVSRSFRQKAAIDAPGELDVFRFQGFRGQSFAVKLTVPKTSGLDPKITLIRPVGSVFAVKGDGTTETSLDLASVTLDAQGTWRLEVRGEEPPPAPPHEDPKDHSDATTGPYSIAVTLGKPTAPGILTDANELYSIQIPAAGDATLAYRVTHSGPPPVYRAFVDPKGVPVAGFPGGLAVKGFTFPHDALQGEYTLVLYARADSGTAQVGVASSLKLPKGPGKRVATLSGTEPVFVTDGVRPLVGGPGTVIEARVENLVDGNEDGTADAEMFLDQFRLVPAGPDGRFLLSDGRRVRGQVPDGIPDRVFSVVVASTSGQVAVSGEGFVRVPAPTVTSIDPPYGSTVGGFEITITGNDFYPDRDRMVILQDGFEQPLKPDYVDETTIRFTPFPHPTPGYAVFGVRDAVSQLEGNLPLNSFQWIGTAAISRILPSLVPILGNETVTVHGAGFTASDKLFLETTTPDVYEEITATQATFVDSRKHRFVAPLRPKGAYRVYVEDTQGLLTRKRELSYFTFSDFTASTNLGALGVNDALSSALGDYDRDGDLDLFLAQRGGLELGGTSATRVLRNEGAGQFADVTLSTMPEVFIEARSSPSSRGSSPRHVLSPHTDDWRADRIALADVNQDGWLDIVLTTNSTEHPPLTLSHTRIMLNEEVGGGGSDARRRIFRNRTPELIAPVRTVRTYGYGTGSGTEYVGDDWRGQDMWVGDIDRLPGPPEILIVHDEVKDDHNPNDSVFYTGVYCGNYCPVAQTGFPYNYAMYFGGARLLFWDKTARRGLGQYRLAHNFFPKIIAPIVPQTLPGGGTIPGCSAFYDRVCARMFTPFTGQRVAVGSLDDDSKPDIAVLSNYLVERRDEPNAGLAPISSLQVALNRPNLVDGSAVTDVTDLITALGGETRGDAVAIGQPGYPNGGSEGVIAITTASDRGTMRVYRWSPGPGVGKFDDVSTKILPARDGTERLHGSRVAWVDADKDGDQDLVLLANVYLGSRQSSLRVFRNETIAGEAGHLTRTFEPLLAAATSPTDLLEGDALVIGDVTGDGLLDFVISRETRTGSGSQTRIIRTDRDR